DHFSNELMTRSTLKAVVAALKFEVRVTNPAIEQADQSEAVRPARPRLFAHGDSAILQTHGKHIVDTLIMLAELVCFEQTFRARFPVSEAIYNCPNCGGLLEACLSADGPQPEEWKKVWRDRRTSNHALDQSGVWRYRELLPFDGRHQQAISLREGNTPLLDAP